MRVIEMSEYGGPDVLRVVERSDPRAGAGQVVVRVRATTVNPVDLGTREGVFADMAPHLTLPFVLGWDVAGVVDSVGDGVQGWDVGARVAAMVPWFEAGAGTYAESVVVDPRWLAAVPDGLDDSTAASIPLNALTARQALDLVTVERGQSVLVTGASGGVGGFAVQLAAQAGARVTAIGSAGDADHVTRLGAATVVERVPGTDPLDAALAAAPGGFDRVVDAGVVGATVIRGVRDGGALVCVLIPAVPAAERGIRVERVGVVPNAGQLQVLLDAAGAGRLTSRIAATLALGDAAEAHRRAAGGLRGKVVLTA